MEQISHGLIHLYNGLLAALNAVTGLWGICFTVVGASLLWIATLEIDEYDRRSAKPRVGRV